MIFQRETVRTLLLFLLLFLAVFVGVLYAIPGMWASVSDATDPTTSLRRVEGKPFDFSFHTEDSGAGVASVRVAVSQDEVFHELTVDEFSPSRPVFDLPIRINPKALGLKEGKARLLVTSKDGALRSNQHTAEAQFLIDYTPPTIVVLSQQFTANEGGVEFLLYRVGGGEYLRTGVQVGDQFFEGFQAGAFDERLKQFPNLAGALFALPFSFNTSGKKIEVFAEDATGQRAVQQVQFPVKPLRQSEVQSKLSKPFLESKVPPIVQSYETRTANTLPETDGTVSALVERFRLVNEQYRKLLKDALAKTVERPTPQQLWHDVFLRPVPGSTTSLFGEQRHYSYDGKDAGGSLHEGLDLASVQNDAIHAVNDGKVVLAGEFGIYGQAIMLDHGVNLYSLYGHLSSLGVKEGDAVKRGQEIGRSGQTGLAGGDHLHFEFRLGTASVNPIEWWDEKWIKDNITGKIEAFLAKEQKPAA